jgi:hypothetical protein
MGTSQEMTKRPRRNRVTGCNRDMFSYPRLTWITFRLHRLFVTGFFLYSLINCLGHLDSRCGGVVAYPEVITWQTRLMGRDVVDPNGVGHEFGTDRRLGEAGLSRFPPSAFLPLSSK